MTGERTPQQSSGPAKSNDDEISLREHIQRQIDIVREGGELRFNMERDHTDESVSFLKEFIERIVTEQDKRYEQRFIAQEGAREVALTRVDKEFHEHLQSVREETRAALNAADKAILKQEEATEKRFDSVNEFRGQLSDQAQTFMPRKESEVKMDALTEKIDVAADRLNALQLLLTSRLDVSQGQAVGGREAIQEKRSSNGALYAAVGFGVSLLMALVTITTIIIASNP